MLEKKKIKINIIPLIDIIFLMLVFFMLATNFYEKRDMEFSIEKNISENSELKETTLIKIQRNEYIFENKKIEKEFLENQLLKIWNNEKSKKFVILNDKSSEVKTLIYILDILKKNKIKNVTFANDPSEKK